MKPEIASLHERMGRGGDWHAFRDEIAALHAEATTEEEYVTLLEAHGKLVAVGKFVYDEEAYAELLRIAAAEYRFFLIKEATEDDFVNPVLLERITRREVEAGRLDPDDDFRTLAVSGASVFGDSAETTAHKCKQGDWFFYGMAIAAALSAGLALIPLSPLWLIALGFLVGWSLNERERRRIKKTIAARRARE
jgi:D-serine deaminase-like pyridoxal phosphate-dependent protein